MLPDFLVVGPPKCASTSLHFYLNQHPAIFMSPEKEINFFNRHYGKGLSFYEHYFTKAKAGQKIGEATPEYAFLPFAADRIKATIPQVKIIFSFRQPAERAFSDWLMFWDAGVEVADFKTAIDINLRQMEHFNYEGEKGAAIWLDRVNHVGQSDKWVRAYIQGGQYGEMLKKYLSLFPTEQVHYLFLDDLKMDFDKSMQSIFTFLGVDGHFIIPDKEDKNFYYDRKVYKNLIKIIGLRPARRLAHLMPDKIKDVFKQKKYQVIAKPQLNEEEKKRLNTIFKPDIQLLESLTGRNLNHWYN